MIPGNARGNRGERANERGRLCARVGRFNRDRDIYAPRYPYHDRHAR